MKIKIINEKKLTKKDKQQKEKYVKGMKPDIKDFEERYGDDAKSVMYATATKMAQKNEEQLDEISAVGGGAGGSSIEGHAGGKQSNPPIGKTSEMEKFNKKQEKEQRLKGKKLSEMYSTSKLAGTIRVSIVSAEKEHAGHVERSQHQGLKNIMQEDDDSTQPMQGGADNFAMSQQGTVWKLSDFADNSRNASRVFDVLRDVEENIGLEKMKNAVLNDKTSQQRIKVMSDKFGYDSELYMNIAMGKEESIKKYYQFIINEFLFWSSFNPMASAQQYSGRASLLSKPTKDLVYAQVYRYVKSPSVNNPKSLGQRVSKQAEEYFLDKDLDPALYDLPEE
jgi:hypothetical protein